MQLAELVNVHHSPDQQWQIDLPAFTRAVEQAAREQAVKELTESFHESVYRALKQG
jgi:hypothetical protein